jgi:hypothetical protein
VASTRGLDMAALLVDDPRTLGPRRFRHGGTAICCFRSSGAAKGLVEVARAGKELADERGTVYQPARDHMHDSVLML